MPENEVGPNIALHASSTSMNSFFIFTVQFIQLYFCQCSSNMKHSVSEQVDGELVYCVKSVNWTCTHV